MISKTDKRNEKKMKFETEKITIGKKKQKWLASRDILGWDEIRIMSPCIQIRCEVERKKQNSINCRSEKNKGYIRTFPCSILVQHRALMCEKLFD
jgi:hypothetical protein